MNNNQPIGIFDSGVGGLTVLHALRNLLPKEDFIYLGDTARLPYGTKSPETVQQYSINAANLLIEKGVKLLVVACNTASSVSLEQLKKQFSPIPVIGVIEPAVRACIEYLGEPNSVGVIGTESTIKWHAYRKEFDATSTGFKILEWPCSLMVALAEQGWVQGPLTKEILHKLLLPFLQENEELPALILGCTHFPVFKDTLHQIMHPNTLIIDSAQWVAKTVSDELIKNSLFNSDENNGFVKYLVTDNPERFMRLSHIFLQDTISANDIEWLHLHQHIEV
jgi:glutamate racemase